MRKVHLFAVIAFIAFFAPIFCQTITVTSPNGGETLTACQQSTITWTQAGTSGFFDVLYSIDNGLNWSAIASNIPGASYSWNPVSNIQSSNVKIRVRDANNYSIQDQSDNFFTITAALILTSPNGGEVWQANTTNNITWNSNILPTSTNLTIQYSTNGGNSWIDISTTIQAGLQTYAWTIPGAISPSNFCYVRIFETAGGQFGCKIDASNNVFSITAATPILTVTAPNTAVTLGACQTYNITWTYQYPPANNAVKLEYTTDNGITWNQITASTNASPFVWTIPQTPSSTCQVKVTSLDNLSIFDVSNVNFTIANPTITVTSPNTAVTYYQHQTPNPNITWTSNNLLPSASVNIDLSLDGGLTWSTLIANTLNDGTQAWPIGAQTPSAQARIRVSTTCNSAFSDISNVNFTIAVPNITVTSPNTNVSYCVGSSTNITWTAPNLPPGNNVKIEYSTDNGSTWITVFASTPNDGTQAWSPIPNTPSGQCLVRISDPLYPANFDISNVVFTIPPVLTNVTSPNGGETLIGCSVHNITFAKCGTTGNTKLEYSLDNGTTWTQIATNITTLTYAWTVPNVSSSQCLIRTTDLISGVTDVSNAVFTINPSIQIVSPNGGEVFQVGGPNQTISWVLNGTFSTTLRLDYSTNNGATWTNIATAISNTTTSYNWIIPNTPSNSCLVRVYEGTTAIPPACKVDQSNSTFTISAATPVITVTSPNTNVTWYTGSTNNITWNYPFFSANNVKVEYSTDNGTTWITVFASTPNDGSEPWATIPNTPSPNCLVRVSDVNNPLISDISNVNFQLVNPTLTLTSPNGGNDLIGCNTFPITWTNVGVTNSIKIEASYDGGLTWNIVIASTANTGSYNWTIPNLINSSNCLIRISNVSLPYVTDQSNAPFSIANNSQVTLYSPNGGEVWTANTTQTISWVASGIGGNMTIQYSTNSGTTWTNISTSVPNTGNYVWTLPNVASSLCLVKIFQTGNPCTADQSNAVFTITAQVPIITVTSPNTSVSWIVGSTNPITWSISNGSITNVKLEYSTNNGTTWTTIVASTPGATGTFNWNIPPTPSNFCLVRVSNVSNAAVNDVSNVNFTIYNAANVQAITVTSPNGGDILAGCSGTSILWNANNCTTVGRLISPTANITNITGTGPWTVTVSVTPTTGLHIGATIFATPGTGNIGVGGTYVLNAAPSATTFTYVATGGAPPVLGTLTNILTTTISTTGTVGSITGGSGNWNATITGMQNTQGLTVGSTIIATAGVGGVGSLGVGGTYTITNIVSASSIQFSATGGTAPINGAVTNIKATNTSYKLDYSSDGGTTWSPIVPLTPQPSNGACSYSWQVPGNVNSSNCLVKVTNATNLAQVDQSDAALTIIQPIVLLQPNFGGAYVAGSIMNISWLANQVSGFYDISYSLDGGASWNVITLNQSIPSNTYPWIVPSTPTNQLLKIRVKENGSTCESDDSDVNASIILNPQAVTVTAPNGGESWATCSSQNITWTNTNASGTYKLEYSTNGGTTWTQIATNISAGPTGSYTWTIPNIVSAACLIRVTDVVTGANIDQSNAAFSINQSVPLTVTSNTAICSGQSVSLLASGATTYSWSPATGLSSTIIANPTAVPSTTTTYTVTGTLNGCTNSKMVTVTVNSIPVVSINQNNVSFCSGVTLQANGASSYSWSPNLGLSNSAIANPVASPSTATLYTVTGTLNGCTDTANVTVNPNPIISANVSSNTICSGTSANLNATGANSYIWTPAIGLSSATISNPIASPLTSQTYTVTGISNGCFSAANVQLTVNASPVLTVGSGGSICAGSSYNLTASGANSYSWTPIAGLSSSSVANPTSTPAVTTTYTVLGSNGSCTASQNVTVAVIPIPTITISGNQTICLGGTTQLTATGGSSYVWTPNTGLNNPYLFSPSASPLSTTIYTVTSTVNGCQGITNVTLNVNNALPTATISAAGATTFCQGDSVVLNANTGLGLTYQWKNNGINIIGSTSASYTAISSGSYSVEVTSNSCSVTSSTTLVNVNALPGATITAVGATTFCQGDSVVLNANTGIGLTYQWKNNGINIIGATSANYTAITSGSYSVEVTNNNNCLSTSSVTLVNVNALPTATISAVGATTFCQGDSVVLNANTGIGLTYQWKNNGINIIGATSASYTAISSGTYTVDVTSNNCSVTSSTTLVNVNALPAATITAVGATTFCQGDSVVLNANTGIGLTYQWKNNSINIIGASSASYTAITSGSYSVEVTNNNNCLSTSSVTLVNVNAFPTATFSAAGATTFCQGDSVVLNANTGLGLTYQWKNNGINIIGATSASYTAISSGSYTVDVTSNSCSATSSTTLVNVNALPAATITAVGATTFCQGDSVVLNGNTGIGLTYQWKNNGINIIGAISASYTAISSGSYSVEVTNNNNCFSTSLATLVNVNNLPIVSLNNFPQVCDTIGSYILTGGSPLGGSYSGTSVNSNVFNTAIGVGFYLVTYTFSDNDGCSSSASENIEVINCNDAALNEIDKDYLRIYPNPTLNEIAVDFSNEKLYQEYGLYDISGRIVLEGKLINIPEIIHLEHIQSGTYYFFMVGSELKIKLIKM